MNRRQFLKAGAAAGVVAGAGVAGKLAGIFDTTYDSGDFSTEQIRVSHSNDGIFSRADLDEVSHPYFRVNFLNVGDSYEDATLAVERKDDGTFDLYVGVKAQVHREEYLLQNGRIDRVLEDHVLGFDLKQFRNSGVTEDQLIGEVHKILTTARDYITSGQYDEDLTARIDKDNSEKPCSTLEVNGGLPPGYEVQCITERHQPKGLFGF